MRKYHLLSGLICLILTALVPRPLNAFVLISNSSNITVSTTKVSDIKATQAKCSFTVQGTPVNEKGVCFSEKPSPSIDGKKSMAPANPANNCVSIMGGLKPATTYYVRAYVKSGSNVFYGNEIVFTTAEGSTEQNKNTGQKSEPKPAGKK